MFSVMFSALKTIKHAGAYGFTLNLLMLCRN